MPRLAVLLLLLCMLTGCAFPVRYTSQAFLDGKVTDMATGGPLAGAKVSSERFQDEPPRTTVTDAQGRYDLPGENAWGIAYLGGEAPKLEARVRIERDGYRTWTDWGYNTFGGGGMNRRWTFDAVLMPDSHPLAPYSAALEKAITTGGNFEAWRAVLVSMRQAGLSRHDADLVLQSNPGVFDLPGSTTYSRSEEALAFYFLIHGGSTREQEVWPNTACADFLQELGKKPPNLKFQQCTREGGEEQPTLHATYYVETKHVPDVVAYFRREADMPDVAPVGTEWAHIVTKRRAYGLLPLSPDSKIVYRVAMRANGVLVYYEQDGTLLTPNFYVDVTLTLTD